MTLILEHTRGPLAGLPQIVGTWDGKLPDSFERFQVNGKGRTIDFASLVEVTPRYAIYRESAFIVGHDEELTAI